MFWYAKSRNKSLYLIDEKDESYWCCFSLPNRLITTGLTTKMGNPEDKNLLTIICNQIRAIDN